MHCQEVSGQQKVLPHPCFSSAQIAELCEICDFCPVPALCCESLTILGQLQQQQQALEALRGQRLNQPLWILFVNLWGQVLPFEGELVGHKPSSSLWCMWKRSPCAWVTGGAEWGGLLGCCGYVRPSDKGGMASLHTYGTFISHNH